MKLDTKVYESKMKKTIEVYEDNLGSVRVGRANAAVLSRVNVDYYGTPTPISSVANVNVSDARTLTITPWDASLNKPIEKAILASDVGITPSNDGKVNRQLYPQLTEERRKELKKQISKMGEDTKVALRNIRREANDKCKEMKKASEMNEDEQKQSEKSVQDLTDKYIKMVDEITAKKDKEIMEI